MSLWRRKADELMPALHHITKSPDVDNPMMMWIKLHCALEEAYDQTPSRQDVVEQIWAYVGWCLEESGNADLQTAVCVAFIEDLLDKPAVREDLCNHLTRQDYRGLREVLCYHNSEEDVDRFELEIYGKSSKWLD